MDVSKRKDKLQRHRCKREPTAPPPIGTNPTHWQNWPTFLSVVYTGADPGQCHQFEYIMRIGRRYVARLPDLVARWFAVEMRSSAGRMRRRLCPNRLLAKLLKGSNFHFSFRSPIIFVQKPTLFPLALLAILAVFAPSRLLSL